MISYRLIINEIFLDIGDRYIQSKKLISIDKGVSFFFAERAKSLLPTLITREVKESLVVDEVEVEANKVFLFAGSNE